MQKVRLVQGVYLAMRTWVGGEVTRCGGGGVPVQCTGGPASLFSILPPVDFRKNEVTLGLPVTALARLSVWAQPTRRPGLKKSGSG